MSTLFQAFVNSNNETVTDNGMAALKSSQNPLVDLFFSVGAARGKDLTSAFNAAYERDPDLTVRLMFWARDIRGGQGERQQFREFLKWLEATDRLTVLINTNPQAAVAFMTAIPVYGRWDDLLVFTKDDTCAIAFVVIYKALQMGNGLAAKWMPRKGPIANKMISFFGLTPKKYRKLLVGLTNVVESDMCANRWTQINFSHVPSVAAGRYTKAFNRHAPAEYQAYRSALQSGSPEVKINAGAVYPYDVIRTLSSDEVIGNAQWEALPNYMPVDGAPVLSICDVSGSMSVSVGGGTKVTCRDVCVSLGLYTAMKNKGAFANMFMTFSSVPQLVTLTGKTLRENVNQLDQADWDMSTNLQLAFQTLLETAKRHSVPASEMPGTIIIYSDMQFNQCVRNGNNTAMDMVRAEYNAAGYELPRVIFWQLNASNNSIPVSYTESGVALVSGFSPSLMTSILGDPNSITPENVMLKTINAPRYDWLQTA